MPGLEPGIQTPDFSDWMAGSSPDCDPGTAMTLACERPALDEFSPVPSKGFVKGVARPAHRADRVLFGLGR
jgi:hypothetical protein